METLNRERGDEFSSCEIGFGFGGVGGQGEIFGELLRDSIEEIELFESRFNVGCVGGIAEVGAVGRTGHECGPEGSAELAGCGAGDVDVACKSAFCEESGEVGRVDFVS